MKNKSKNDKLVALKNKLTPIMAQYEVKRKALDNYCKNYEKQHNIKSNELNKIDEKICEIEEKIEAITKVDISKKYTQEQLVSAKKIIEEIGYPALCEYVK